MGKEKTQKKTVDSHAKKEAECQLPVEKHDGAGIEERTEKARELLKAYKTDQCGRAMMGLFQVLEEICRKAWQITTEEELEAARTLVEDIRRALPWAVEGYDTELIFKASEPDDRYLWYVTSRHSCSGRTGSLDDAKKVVRNVVGKHGGVGVVYRLEDVRDAGLAANAEQLYRYLRSRKSPV